jgi:hypothetical protein
MKAYQSANRLRFFHSHQRGQSNPFAAQHVSAKLINLHHQAEKRRGASPILAWHQTGMWEFDHDSHAGDAVLIAPVSSQIPC